MGLRAPFALAGQTAPSASDASLSYFGAETVLPAGANRVTVIGIVRNGSEPLPANSLRMRLYPLTNLDYTFGETRPVLPALGPNQTATCRWTLSTKSGDSAATVAVFLESVRPDFAFRTQTRIALLPFLGPTGPEIAAPTVKISTAPGAPPVFADLLKLRAYKDADGNAALGVFVREGKYWSSPAFAFPLISVSSGELGQNPWEEPFRLLKTRIIPAPTSTTLLLSGEIGRRWTAEVEIEILRDTVAANGKVRLIARRDVVLSSLALPTFLSSVSSQPADGAPHIDSDASAGRNERSLWTTSNNRQFGLSITDQSPSMQLEPRLASVGKTGSSIVWSYGAAKPITISAGTKMTFPFRLFLTPVNGPDPRKFALH